MSIHWLCPRKKVLADDEMAVVGSINFDYLVWSITVKIPSGCIGRLRLEKRFGGFDHT